MEKRKRFLVDLTEQNHELLRQLAFKERTTIKRIANHILTMELKGR